MESQQVRKLIAEYNKLAKQETAQARRFEKAEMNSTAQAMRASAQTWLKAAAMLRDAEHAK
jgi:hypothetical protein